jgi:CubicO group peptidase (beta-lactamase class C family)
MDRSALPGASLVLVRDGRVILAKGYGFADYKSRRPVEVEQSLFRQASVSKLFTWLS